MQQMTTKIFYSTFSTKGILWQIYQIQLRNQIQNPQIGIIKEAKIYNKYDIYINYGIGYATGPDIHGFRGVKLWGIDSSGSSIKRREFVWNEVKNLIDFDKLEQSIKTINLEELLDIYPKMLKGETSGRYIIDLNK